METLVLALVLVYYTFMLQLCYRKISEMYDVNINTLKNKLNLFTITLVKRIGVAFFLRSHFFRFTRRFRIFGRAFVYNR